VNWIHLAHNNNSRAFWAW